MKDDALKHLFDIREALTAVKGFVSGNSFKDYSRDELLRAQSKGNWRSSAKHSIVSAETAHQLPDRYAVTAMSFLIECIPGRSLIIYL